MRFWYNIVFLLSFICWSYSSLGKQAFPEEIGYLSAKQINYDHVEQFIEAKGSVDIITKNYQIRADKALFDIKENHVWVEGNIIAIDTHGRKMIADHMEFNPTTNQGTINNLGILLPPTDVVAAKLAIKKDEHKHEFIDAAYSPCIVCKNKQPIWQIRAAKTKIDFGKQTISYRKATFEVFGTKILYLPYFAHPTPNADAKSGFLVPQVRQNTLKIPVYYRIKPNMDLTYSPRINRKYLINELEYRHLLEQGSYSVKGSYNRSKTVEHTKENDPSIKDSTYQRYHIKSRGDFKASNINYGFDFERVSDKSYLKNFYQDNRDFLKSNLYVSNFQEEDYSVGDLLYFQGLRVEDSDDNAPAALPRIRVKRTTEFDNGVQLNFQDTAIHYQEGSFKRIGRNNLVIDLTKYYYGEEGQLLNITAYNRMDLYQVSKKDYSSNRLHPSKARQIPELQIGGRWPIFFPIKNHYLIIEPQFQVVLGRNKPSNVNKYYLIDSPNYELNEYNIFTSNRYSGLDFHEYGRRLSYGLNARLNISDWNFDGFMGQLIKHQKTTTNSKSDYVGKIGANYSGEFEIYYRFQKRQKEFKPYRDEVGLWVNSGPVSITNSLIILRDLAEYNQYAKLSPTTLKKNKISQNYTYIDYKVTDKFKLFGDTRIDLAEKRKIHQLSNGIGFSYDYDCVSTTFKIANDYTADKARNIKKTNSFSFGIGLKTINM